jgi:MFS family permease
MARAVPRSFWWIVFWAWASLGAFELLLPLFSRALGATSTTIGWLFGVFAATSLLLRPIVGRLLDRYPRHPFLLAGLACYVLVLLLFAVADTIATLFIARLLQGIASTATWLTATVLIADWAGSERQGRWFGRYQAISVWGAVIGAVWAGAALLALDEDTRRVAMTFAQSFGVSAQLFVQYLEEWIPSAWPTLSVLQLVFAGNTLFALVALAIALRLEEPKYRASGYMQLRPPREAWSLVLTALLYGVAAGLVLPIIVLLLDDRWALGGVGVGIAYIVPGIVYAVAPEPLGRLADRWGYRTAAMFGLLGVMFAYGAVPFVPAIVLVVALLSIEALGLSLAGPALLALVAKHGGDQRGSAYGWYSMASVGGVALGSPLGGWLYEGGPVAPFTAAAACALAAAISVRGAED